MLTDLCNSIFCRNAPVESSTKKPLKTSTHSSSHKEVCSHCFVFYSYCPTMSRSSEKTQRPGDKAVLYLWILEVPGVGTYHYANIIFEEQKRKCQDALICLFREKKSTPVNIMTHYTVYEIMIKTHGSWHIILLFYHKKDSKEHFVFEIV